MQHQGLEGQQDGYRRLVVFSLVMDIAQFAGEEWPGTKESGAEPMSQAW